MYIRYTDILTIHTQVCFECYTFQCTCMCTCVQSYNAIQTQSTISIDLRTYELGSEENCVLAYQAHNRSCNSNFIINFTTSKLFSTQGVPRQDDNDEYMDV